MAFKKGTARSWVGTASQAQDTWARGYGSWTRRRRRLRPQTRSSDMTVPPRGRFRTLLYQARSSTASPRTGSEPWYRRIGVCNPMRYRACFLAELKAPGLDRACGVPHRVPNSGTHLDGSMRDSRGVDLRNRGSRVEEWESEGVHEARRASSWPFGWSCSERTPSKAAVTGESRCNCSGHRLSTSYGTKAIARRTAAERGSKCL